MPLFRQIWNQRHANFWVWVELCIVTVLLWYAADLLYNYEGAALSPKGYDTDCVFDITLGCKPGSSWESRISPEARSTCANLYRLVREYPGVEEACYYHGSVPYSSETMYEGYASHADSAHWVNCYIRYVSPSFFRVFRLHTLAGALDESHWRTSEYPMPALMSAELSDSLFHSAGPDAVGKTCFNPYWLNSQQPETNYRLMAVLSRHKLDDYQRYEPFIYLPAEETPVYWSHFALRVSPDHAQGFIERFERDMRQPFDAYPFYLASVASYRDMKEAYDIEQGTVNYLNTSYAVIVFFVFNIFLCMLGTFWFRTRKRRSEIALRMAMGSTRRGVMNYCLLEGLCLLLIAALPALVICFNIRLADLTVHTLMEPTVGRFFFCFLVALLVLVLVIVAGIWFPARQAMKVQPAEALNDE